MKVLNSIFSKLLMSFFLISIIPLLLTHWFTYTNAKEELSVKLERETLNILDQNWSRYRYLFRIFSAWVMLWVHIRQCPIFSEGGKLLRNHLNMPN